MSPLWGFGYLVHAACYKHAAPLGLNTGAFPSFFSSPLRSLGRCVLALNFFPVFNPVHPLILSILIQTNGTCRPSGDLVIWYMPRAINMPPRWG